MTLSSPGGGSGLDVNTIVSQLMSIERSPLDRFDRCEVAFQAQLSACGNMRTAEASLRSVASVLSKAALRYGRV